MSAPRRVTLAPGDAATLAESLRPVMGEGPAGPVAAALADVRARGDAALVDAIRQFDAPGFAGTDAVVPPEALVAAEAALTPELRAAIGEAISNVRTVAEASLPSASSADLPAGQSVRIEAIPVGAAGVYAPGGRAAYPSSVIMGVVPAQVAGVARIVLATPAGPDGLPNPVVLATASILGVDQVIAVGGAARHASSVGPATYMRRMALVSIPQSAVDRLTPHLAALADAEGFPEHRRSAEVRASS